MDLVDDKYELISLLGKGGMGAVYEARHKGTGRRVALKLISEEALARSPEIAGRFQREARVTGQIESKHIAQILDTGRDAKTARPYLVIELLRGEDLAQLIGRTGPIEPEVALRITAQALTGLSKAHAASIIHRDIKPANLFLARGEGDEVVVKILDFGIAKIDPLHAGVQDAALTRTGSMLGSPLYMSPEQAKSAKKLDHRCDLWAIGVVLYEALSGVTPYGDVDTIGGLILEICSGTPRNVQDHARWVSPQVAAIVHRALAPEISARYPSADAMLGDIGALLPNGSALKSAMLAPITPASRSVLPPPFETLRPSVSPYARTEAGASSALATSIGGGLSQSQSSPRARFPWAVALVAGVGVSAVAGATYYQSRTSAPSPTSTANAPASATPTAPPSMTPTASATATPSTSASAAASNPAPAKRVVPAIRVDAAAPRPSSTEVDRDFGR